MTTAEEEYARTLITSGVHVAETLNTKVFNVPEFRKWSNETLMLGTICSAAGFARCPDVDLPEDDFVLLARTAHQLLRAEPKKKEDA